MPNNDYEAFIDAPIEELLEVDKIKHLLNWPQINNQPINEYSFDGLASLLFPKLFPNGAGDPTRKARLRHVTETQGIKFHLQFFFSFNY